MPDAEFILRIILRARDEMAGALAKARAELALLTNQSQQWRSELKRLNGELDNFFSRLDRFSKRATSNIKDEITAHRQATSSSGVLANAVGKLGDEEQKMGQKVRSASQDVRRSANDLRSHRQVVASGRNEIEKFGNELLSSSKNMKTWGDNIGATDNKLRGLIVAAALIFIQELDTAVVGLGGGLVELASSAAMAGGALGGILAAGAAQALPVIGELAAAAHRVSMVWDVVQQQQKVNQQQSFRSIQDQKAQAGASNALANAQDGVAQAHRGVTVAEEGLSKARKQAFRDIQDLNIAAKQSIIQEEQAALAHEDARKALADALAAGDIDAARRARIQLQEATDNEQKAKIDRQRAQADAALANRQGVNRNPQVVAAQRALDDANRSVTQAERGLKKARTDAHAANQDMFAARSNLQYMLAQLSPAERRLYQALTAIQTTYKKAFRPITDTIINSFTYAVDRGEQILKDPALIGAADVLAKSINQRIRGAVDSFTDPRTLGQFLEFTKEAAHNLAPLANIGEDFGHIFLDIAQDALPAFHDFLIQVDHWVGAWRKWIEDNPAKVTKFFSEGESQLEAWLRLAGAVIKLFAAITSAGGAQGGLDLIQRLTASLNRATRWINLHQQTVHQFFENVNTALGILGNTVKVIAGIMYTLFSPGRLQNFAQFFNGVLLPAFEAAAWSLGLILDFFLKISEVPGIGTLMTALITLTLISKALRGPWDLLLGGIGKTIRQVGGFIEVMKLAKLWTEAFFRADAGINLAKRWGAAKTAVDEYKLAQKEAMAQTAETTAVVEEQQAVESKQIFGPRGNVISTVEKGGVRGGATAAEGAVGAEVASGATAAEGSIMSGIAGSIGGLALGGIGIAAGLGVINGISDVFSSKANQLNFGGKVQEFLHGATFGIIPSAADEQAKLYVRSLGAAVKGRLDDPQIRRDFTPRPTPVRGLGAGNTAFANVQQHRISGERQQSGDPADIVDPMHQLSSHQRDIVRSLSQYRDTFDKLRAMGVTTFGSLIDQLDAFQKKNPEAAGAVDDLLKHIERFQHRVSDITKASQLSFDFGNALQLDPKHAETITENFLKSLKKLSPRARAEAANTAKGIVAGLVSQHKLTADAGKKIDDTISGSIAHMRRRTRAQSAHAAAETSKNIGIMLNTVGLMNSSFVSGINKILDGLGVTKHSASQWANVAGSAVGGGFGALIQAGAQALDDSGNAAGGFVNKAGQTGKDTVVTALGNGEAVLNWAHQRMVEPAMRAYWGMGLGDMFRMRSAYHGGGPGNSLGFAGGGFVNSVGAHVDTETEKKIAAALERLGKAMGITFSPVGPRSARRTPQENAAVGGATGSMHLQGRAMDVAPDLVKSIANSVLHKFGLDRPMPGNWVDNAGNVHDERNHLVLWGGGSGGGAQGAVQAVIQRLKRMPHMPGHGAEVDIVNAAIKKVQRAGQRFVDRHAGSGADFSGIDGGGNNQANRSLGRRMMARLWSGSQWPFLDKLINQESGWSTTALNKSSGAFGIGQFLGGTLRQYAKFGATSTRAKEQIAAMLKYVKDRYGSPAAAWAHEVAHNWYDKGGIIPGHIGKAVNIVAHGGEWVLNKGQQAAAAAMAGLSPDALRSALGFSGGPSSFAGGGQVDTSDVELQGTAKRLMNLLLLQAGTVDVGARRFQRQRTQIGSVEGISGDIKLNFDDIRGAILGVEKRLRDLNTHGAKSVRTIESRLASLQRQGGLFDKLTGSVDAMDKAMTRGLNARAFFINKAGQVMQRMSPAQVHSEQLNNLVAHYDALAGEKGVLNKALRANANQIRDAEKELRTAKGAKAKEQAHKALTDLRSFRTNIEVRVQGVSDDMQQAMQDRLQAQIQVQQDIVDGINKAFSSRSDALNSAQRIMTALGQTGASSMLADAQVELLKNQRDALKSRIEAARAAGANDLADQLETQVEDLNASIVEAVVQNIQNAIDQINATAQRKMGRLDLVGRMADALGQVGLGGAGATVGGVTLTRSGVFDARNTVLTDQRSALQGTLNTLQATQPADVKQIQDLTDQLAELDVTIQENSRAQFQARIDDVTSQADFALSVNDLNKQLIDAQGAISGNTDTAAESNNLAERGNILTDEHNKLLALYNEAVARSDQKAQNDLTIQLKQNELAQLENTKALIDVNGSLNTQQLSSTAWQQFRTAIFTSMGNLLPQYQIPAMGTPSMWGASTTMTKPQAVQQTVNEGDTNVYVTEPMQVLDADYVAHTIAFQRGGQG